MVTPNWTGAPWFGPHICHISSLYLPCISPIGAPWFGPLKRLAADSLILPAGSLRAVAQRTDHVKSWRAVAFYVPPRDA